MNSKNLVSTFAFVLFLTPLLLNAHPAGLISHAACGKNEYSSSLKEVCIGSIGAGGFHSDGAPEVILTLFLISEVKDGSPGEVALPVTYGGQSGRLVLRYVNPMIPIQNSTLRFANLSVFKVIDDGQKIMGIEGNSPGGEIFKVHFNSPLDLNYFSLIQ